MNNAITRTLAISSFALLMSACAGTQKVPVEAKFGLSSAKDNYKNFSIFQGSSSSNDPGFSLEAEIDPGVKDRIVYSGGYQQLSDIEFDGLYMGVDDVGKIETEMLTVSAGYRYPFTDRFSAGGRIGAAAVDVNEQELFGGVPEKSSASETVPYGGITMKYRVNDRFAISANYDRYLDVGEEGETGEGDIDVFGLSFDISFGASRGSD
ncbi:MAG: outer membrane beta-barrel protein [Pseudomonadota bacterium]